MCVGQGEGSDAIVRITLLPGAVITLPVAILGSGVHGKFLQGSPNIRIKKKVITTHFWVAVVKPDLGRISFFLYSDVL